MTFLRLKRGPNSFTALVASGRVRSRPEITTWGRPDFKYIHGPLCISLVVFRKKLQTASETTSVPLYNLHNDWIVSQRTILIAATSVDFSRCRMQHKRLTGWWNLENTNLEALLEIMTDCLLSLRWAETPKSTATASVWLARVLVSRNQTAFKRSGYARLHASNLFVL